MARVVAAVLAGAVTVALLGMARTQGSDWEYRLEPKIGTRMAPVAPGEHAYQAFFDGMAKDGWDYVDSFGGDPSGQGAPFTLVFRRPKR